MFLFEISYYNISFTKTHLLYDLFVYVRTYRSCQPSRSDIVQKYKLHEFM